MREKRQTAGALPSLLLAAFLAPPWALTSSGQGTPSEKEQAKEQAEDAAGFKEFSDRVQQYVQLHKSVESTLPSLKPTDRPQMIAAHQEALARKIREARPQAQVGDIFTSKVREAFRHAIRGEFQGPQAPHARATIRQGDPVKEVHLRVNQVYPKAIPYTTVPPTLLLKLPKLPPEVVYRIVGGDLVLLDDKANLVVDLIPEVIPIAP
ncbi:MAG TPA: hypothetical protein VKE24_13525 [Candidatus Acidoferrales bacterium]|nr:hypothetical protein [Candidatus Acidoferrales bacterium]